MFGGCLRDFKLNEMKFDVPPLEIGTVPCSQYIEEGLYFGQSGGYAILNKDLKVNEFLAYFSQLMLPIQNC